MGEADYLETSWSSFLIFVSFICSFMACYTLVILLDHDRWMKEWGFDHEAVPVMHLKFPVVSSAVVLGTAGMVIPHYIVGTGLILNGVDEVRFDVLLTFISLVVSMGSTAATLEVAKRDKFSGANRVETLKTCILNMHTITVLKTKKNVGRNVAYFAELKFITGAAVILSLGITSSHILGVLALKGDFIVVWGVHRLVCLVVGTLAWSMVTCWLLFRILVWKPTHEELRPFVAAIMSSLLCTANYCGDMATVAFTGRDDDGASGWALWTLPFGGMEGVMLSLSVVFLGTILTQYAIGLELRLAYCGLQDANLDLQIMASGMGAGSRRVSMSPHRGSVQGSKRISGSSHLSGSAHQVSGQGERYAVSGSQGLRLLSSTSPTAAHKNQESQTQRKISIIAGAIKRKPAPSTWSRAAKHAVVRKTSTKLVAKGATAFGRLGSRVGLLPPLQSFGKVNPGGDEDSTTSDLGDQEQGIEKGGLGGGGGAGGAVEEGSGQASETGKGTGIGAPRGWQEGEGITKNHEATTTTHKEGEMQGTALIPCADRPVEDMAVEDYVPSHL